MPRPRRCGSPPSAVGAQGTKINLERSLKVGDELGGHIVAGHADGLAVLAAREDLTEMARLTFRAPAALARFIAQKGSVALDGVSLTVNDVTGDDVFGADHPAHAWRSRPSARSRSATRSISKSI